MLGNTQAMLLGALALDPDHTRNEVIYHPSIMLKEWLIKSAVGLPPQEGLERQIITSFHAIGEAVGELWHLVMSTSPSPPELYNALSRVGINAAVAVESPVGIQFVDAIALVDFGAKTAVVPELDDNIFTQLTTFADTVLTGRDSPSGARFVDSSQEIIRSFLGSCAVLGFDPLAPSADRPSADSPAAIGQLLSSVALCVIACHRLLASLIEVLNALYAAGRIPQIGLP